MPASESNGATIDISRFIKTGNIIYLDNSRSKEDIIRTLCKAALQKYKPELRGLTSNELFEAVIERERMQSTGIGEYLAFPHARIKGWGSLAIVIGISRQGVEFDSIDNKPVKLVFLMISSEDEPYIVLQAMSAVIRFLKGRGRLDRIIRGEIAVENIFKELSREDVDATEFILARDIMRRVENFVYINDSVEKVTNIMHLSRQDILPVIDKNNKFYGQVSCLDIFEYGLPHFFRRLKTISFVRHIDPFEKYFRIKKGLKVEDVMDKNAPCTRDDVTLVEIIFDLAVKHKDKLFIVDKDNKLLGIIDRFSVIDKILFF